MYTLYKVSLLISLSSSKTNVGTTLGLEPMQNPPKGLKWGRGARREVTSQDQVSQQMRKTLKQHMRSLHERTIEPQNTYRRVFQLGKRLTDQNEDTFQLLGQTLIHLCRTIQTEQLCYLGTKQHSGIFSYQTSDTD